MELKHCFEIGWYNVYMIFITTGMSHEWRIYNIYNNLIPELIFKSYMVISSFMLYIYYASSFTLMYLYNGNFTITIPTNYVEWIYCY